jgi:uncharacterized membrane protein
LNGCCGCCGCCALCDLLWFGGRSLPLLVHTVPALWLCISCTCSALLIAFPPAYVSMRQHTVYVSMRQHTSQVQQMALPLALHCYSNSSA